MDFVNSLVLLELYARMLMYILMSEPERLKDNRGIIGLRRFDRLLPEVMGMALSKQNLSWRDTR